MHSEHSRFAGCFTSLIREMSSQIAIVTPVLTRTPKGHAPWERDAGIEEVARIVRAVDALGYHHVTCSEHVAIPAEIAERRGGTYWDPLAVFGYLAA